MGAAGIACSTSEMSAKGKSGMLLDLDKVPAREEGMTAYELLLSESQERMLVVAEKGREQEIIDVYKKWDLNAVVIGHVTDTKRVIYQKEGGVKADIPADSLVLGGGAPVYKRETKKPAYLEKTMAFDEDSINEDRPFEMVICDLLASPNIASKRWVYEQYDTMVRTNTVSGPGPSDAAVIRLKGTDKGLAVKTDCNGRYVYLNPRKGGQIAVMEAARNVVCAGGKPVAITNCLNFGNPYKPELYWVFKEAVGGMGDACKVLNTPVTGGNVSFYNENPKGAVFPTPTIGMLGIVESVERDTTTASFKSEGDVVLYIGAPRRGLGASEYLSWCHKITAGDAPVIDLQFEKKLQSALLLAIRSSLIEAAHDLSDGGLAITLAEMAIFGNIGAALDVSELGGITLDTMFSEAQSGVVISVKPDKLDAVTDHFKQMEIPIYNLGIVKGDNLKIQGLTNLKVSNLKSIYEGAIPEAMKQ
ncbi:MAG TPA: phosphoribosylformylglycinamidine synthase subunit PurL, partial [Bacteroidetes bacterium]|nr:phosphoribosylformylglycinamidine synthase subunit PurL [Bacteroidota bacterium]